MTLKQIIIRLRGWFCQSGLEKIEAFIGKQETLKTLKFSCFSMKLLSGPGHCSERLSLFWLLLFLTLFMVNTSSLRNYLKQDTSVETLQKPGTDIEFDFVAFSAAAKIICIFNQVNGWHWSQL